MDSSLGPTSSVTRQKSYIVGWCRKGQAWLKRRCADPSRAELFSPGKGKRTSINVSDWRIFERRSRGTSSVWQGRTCVSCARVPPLSFAGCRTPAVALSVTISKTLTFVSSSFRSASTMSVFRAISAPLMTLAPVFLPPRAPIPLVVLSMFLDSPSLPITITVS